MEEKELNQLEATKEKGRVKRILGILSPFVVYLLIALLADILLVIFKAIINLIKSGQSGALRENSVMAAIHRYVDNDSSWNILMLFLIQIIGIIVFCHWYSKSNDIKKEVRKDIFSVRSLGILALIGIGMNLIISGAFIILLPLIENTMHDYSELVNRTFDGNQVISYIIAFLLAPITEELMVRGITMKKAEKLFPFTIANIIQALIFGIMHANIIQSTYAFVFGLILGYVAHKYQSIIASILLHAIFNLFGTLLSINGSVYIAPFYIVAGIVLLFFMLKQISKIKIPQEEPMTEIDSL